MATAPVPTANATNVTRPLPRAERREAILAAAAAAFATAGYAATSMDDIAAASGVTKLIVYRHFDSKEALYRAVLEQVFDRQAQLFVENVSRGLQAAGATSALLTAAREWPNGFRLLWRHAAREAQFAEYTRHLRDIAVDAARGPVSTLVASTIEEWAAQTLFDHLVDAVLNWLDHGDEARDDEFVNLETGAIQATLTAWNRVAPR